MLSPRRLWVPPVCLLVLLSLGCSGEPTASDPGTGMVIDRGTDPAATRERGSNDVAQQPTTSERSRPMEPTRAAGGSGGTVMTAPFLEVKHPVVEACQYRNGDEANVSSIVESLGGGVGVADFDSDGWPDLFLPGGGRFEPPEVKGLPTRLVRNLGDFNFADVSQASRIARSDYYSHAATVADANNDGFPDCLITGYGGLQLWMNQGDGTFVESKRLAGLDETSWSSSAAWMDLNQDGHLDLYVCHYVDWSFDKHPACPTEVAGVMEICSPRDFQGLDDTLYLSNGDGTYRDATKDWGLVPGGKGLGVVAGDVDGDGKIDLYVANETVENFLYMNTGQGLEELASVAGVGVDDQGIPNGSMGVEFGDLNGDLRPDLWCANYERESFALYRNEGSGLFLHVSRPTGITALGGLFVGFGSAFFDADGDGDLDVAVVNGHVLKYPKYSQRRQKPLLLINDRPRFRSVKFPADHYFETQHEGRGLATGDLDRDGHLDLVATHLNGSPALLRNNAPAERRSLVVRLIGTSSNRDGIGCQAILTHSGGQYLRTLNGGGSYLSTHEAGLWLEFPTGTEPQRLDIRWPSGASSTIPLDASSEGELYVFESATGGDL